MLVILALAGMSACTNQDDIYKQWVHPAGLDYPEKSNHLAAYSGHNRIKLTWAYPKDPSVVSAKIFWENRLKSMALNYADYAGQDSVSVIIDNLDERSYSFEIENYDASGNVSMVTALSALPYAEVWLSNHAEREIKSAEITTGSAATIKTGFGTNEMMATKFRYVNTAGDTVELAEQLDPNTASITFPDAVSGKRFEYCSGYCPAQGLDTLWNTWRKSPTPIAGKLNAKGFSVVATEGTAYGSYTPNKIFDGVRNNLSYMWWARYGNFPKILAIDTGKDTYMFNKFILWQSETVGGYNYRTNNNVSIYFGNEPFDPNAGAGYATTAPFANALLTKSTVFWNGTTNWTGTIPEYVNARYIAIVFANSRRNGNALFEVELFGYDNAPE